jgi:hypothetical protein
MVSFAIVSPWFIKSWIQTGNPLWPFFQDVLGGRNWDALGTEYLIGFIQLANMDMTLRNWLLGLWHLTAKASRFGPDRVTLGWFYLVLLPAFVPSWLCSPGPRRRVLTWLSLIALLLYTAWFSQTHQARFLLPTLPVLALLGASGVVWLWSAKPDVWRVSVQVLLLVSLISASWLCQAKDRETILSRLPFLVGNETRGEFLMAFAPGYAAYQYANEHLPEDTLVSLALYESRGYYLDREYVWMNPISQRLLRLEEFPDPKSLAEKLWSMGVTHLLFAPERLERYSYIRYGEQYTDLALGLVEQHGQLLYETPDLVLYAIKP